MFNQKMNVNWIDREDAWRILEDGGYASDGGSIWDKAGTHRGYIGSGFKREWDVIYVVHLQKWYSIDHGRERIAEHKLSTLIGA